MTTFLKTDEWEVTHENEYFECPECEFLCDLEEKSHIFYPGKDGNPDRFLCKTCAKLYKKCKHCQEYYYHSFVKSHEKQCKKKDNTTKAAKQETQTSVEDQIGFICGLCCSTRKFSDRSNLHIVNEKLFPDLCKACADLFFQCEKCEAYKRTYYHECACVNPDSRDIVRKIEDD